jgi:hypothetical protein
MLWNIACDYVINGDLHRMGYPIDKVIGSTVTFKQVCDILSGDAPPVEGSMLDPKFGPEVDSEELFHKLLAALKKNPNPSGGGGTEDDPDGEGNSGGKVEGKAKGAGIGAGMGGDMDWDAKGGSAKEEGITPEQADRLAETTVAAAAEAARSRGSLPGFMSGIIDKINRPSNEWKAILRRFVTATARDDYSYRRPSRRQSFDNILRPGAFSEAVGHIVAIIDESGSVSDAELQQALSELYAVSRRVKPEAITIVTCDTRVTSVTSYKKGETPKELKTNGRGGTDMKPAFDYIRKQIKKPACIVCFTDGEMNFYDKSIANAPVLWAICNPRWSEQHNPSWGTMIRVEVQ